MRKRDVALPLLVLAALSAALSPQPAPRPPPAKPTPEILKLWSDLEPRREQALSLAKVVTDATMPQARQNRDELAALTKTFNEAIDPIAAASPIRPGAIPPRKGLDKAIWFYKTSRQIEAYNASRKDEMSAEEFKSIELLNAYRESLGALPLEFDPRLHASAEGHAQWMHETQQCEHAEPENAATKAPAQRMERAGYHWRSCGENIALGQPTPEWVFKDWFESHEHHHNLVGDYAHIGISMIDHAWVQNFASGSPTKAAAYKPAPSRPGATSKP